jgi:transposase
MTLPNDLSRCLADFDPHTTLIAGLVPGIERNPLKKMEPDPAGLQRLLEKWREEAIKAGSAITRVAIAFEAGRDGFW